MDKRKRIIFIAFMILFFYVCARGQDNKIKNDVVKAVQEKLQIESVVWEVKVKEAKDSSLPFEMLSQSPIRAWNANMIRASAYWYADRERGGFEPNLEYDGDYPQKLVTRLEEELSVSLEYELSLPSEELQQGRYFRMLEEFGASRFEVEMDEVYELFPEITEGMEFEELYQAFDYVYQYAFRDDADAHNYSCTNLFHFQFASGIDDYLFVLSNKGTTTVPDIILAERVGDELSAICHFQTPNNGYGRVIESEGNYFYVIAHMREDEMLDFYDGIRLYKLGVNADTENMLIEYLPRDYTWGYTGVNWEFGNKETEFIDKLDNYIGSIKTQIISDGYIADRKGYGADVFFGDEVQENVEYDVIDFTNTETAMYMKREQRYNPIHRTWYLDVQCYLPNPQTGSMVEQEIQIEDGRGSVILKQLWFKIIDDRVVTFRLYDMGDYVYLLNTSLIEGDEITILRNDILIPQKEYFLTEGKSFWTM